VRRGLTLFKGLITADQNVSAGGTQGPTPLFLVAPTQPIALVGGVDLVHAVLHCPRLGFYVRGHAYWRVSSLRHGRISICQK
jgi:hypothetical protein